MKKVNQKFIKIVFMSGVLLGIVGEISAQKVAIFREGTFLQFDERSKRFLTMKGDASVCLKEISKPIKSQYEEDGNEEINGKLKSYSVQKDGVNLSFEFKPKVDLGSVFSNSELVNKLIGKKLYGDIVQKDSVLLFKPWKLYKVGFRKVADSDKNVDSILNNINLKIDIPNRVVVQVKYRALQYGTLSLPVKTYFKNVESIDSLSNFAFGANLGLMIGRRGGKKKYYFNTSESKGSYYGLSSSLNIVVGLSELKLNKLNTIVEHNEPLSHDVSILNLSLGIAGGLHYKNIGAYLVLGMDRPLSKKFGDVWKFGNSPLWLGLGFGLNL